MGEKNLKVIEAMERMTRQMDDMEMYGITSIVAYGTDIQKDIRSAHDYNLLIVVRDVDLNIIKGIHESMEGTEMKGLGHILIMEKSEIEGMMDSVPETFLQILVSFQTLYGSQPFKGLSSISHEHLRAQTERCLREALCRSRMDLMDGMEDRTSMVRSIREIKTTMEMSMKIFHVMSKPWITELSDHREAMKEEFPGVSIWLDMLDRNGLDELEHGTLQSLAHNIINEGIKPMLMKVDEMGP